MELFCGFWSLLENEYPRKQPVALSRVFSKMALLKYFKPTKAPMASTLPFPNGPLSEVMPSSSIEAANKEVKSIILGRGNFKSKNDTEGNDVANTAAMKRGPYVKFSQGVCGEVCIGTWCGSSSTSL